MFDFPSSNAMDAAVRDGGPGAVLAEILTGSPERVARHSTGLFGAATELIALQDEFALVRRRLDAAWSGRAAASTVRKLDDALAELHRITADIEHGAALLRVAGSLVASAQIAYQLVVSELNPTVAELMAQPAGRVAAAALSEMATASLREFLTILTGLLHVIGGDIQRLAELGRNERRN